MIESSDLNPHGFPLTENQEHNLEELAHRLSLLETVFLKTPGSSLFKITSGFRSLQDHYRIYKAKGIDHPPMGSKHLTGEAVDVLAPDHGALKVWLLSEPGLQVLEDLEFYCELFDYTKSWAHFQVCPPASGKRFFQP